MIDLSQKIHDRSAKIAILGLGYVGLPLAMAFTEHFKVVGFDVTEPIIAKLKRGESHIQDVPDQAVKESIGRTFFPTCDLKDLSSCDFFILCVPTPLMDGSIPDLSYVESAVGEVASILRPGHFVVLESTTYPGTTDEIVVPILERTGLKAGVDFGVAYSPERIDPGIKGRSVRTVPKVVGGYDQRCTDIAAELYASVIDKVVRVSDTRTAESVKMVENIFRNVNIALVNELSLIFERMGIDTWEVIDAAASKPYGYMPFYPGPGIGGHCIPLDPYYMSYKAKRYGFIPRFIETSGEINEFMKVHTVNLTEAGLRKAGKELSGSNITVMGVAYKKNIDDTRESPAKEIIDELVRNGAKVKVFDPRAPSIRTNTGVYISSSSWKEALNGVDCALFLVDHDQFREMKVLEFVKIMSSPVIIDCRNIFRPEPGTIYLGIGKGEK